VVCVAIAMVAAVAATNSTIARCARIAEDKLGLLGRVLSRRDHITPSGVSVTTSLQSAPSVRIERSDVRQYRTACGQSKDSADDKPFTESSTARAAQSGAAVAA
jgi:hypothetical protein